MATQTVSSGPYKGVIDSREPDDDTPDFLTAALNIYIPDPQNGSGAYQRPGAVLRNAGASLGTIGQCVYEHIALDGSRYVFAFVDGNVYRSNSTFSVWTDVSPTNLIIQTGTGSPTFIYCTSLNDELIVNDGVNKPWRGSNLGATPITGTPIEFDTPSIDLSLGSNNTRVATAEFTYLYRAGGSIGTQATFAAVPVGTTLPVGTIPSDQWGVFLVELNSSPALVITAGANNFTSGYSSESAALAAVPARTATRWYVGYFTVKTASGTAFIDGTDALKGGTGGNVASETNYYAGEGSPWSAFGPAKKRGVYQGSIAFILQQVATVYARATFAWSEPDEPETGYSQDGFDNVFSLIQTDTSPLYSLGLTNAGIFYARQLSWGMLVGTLSIDLQNTTTNDAVCENVGTISPASVDQFGSYIYFADAQGRPCRFALGDTSEPIWLAMRAATEANRQNATALGQLTNAAWGIVEPNLNVYLFGFPTEDAITGYCPTVFYVFDAQTGRYAGTWEFQNGEAMQIGGLVQSPDGVQVLLMLGTNGGTARGYVWQLTVPTDHNWQDNGMDVLPIAQSSRMGYGVKNQQQVGEVRALTGIDTPCTATTITTNGVTTMQAQAPIGVTLLSRGSNDTRVASVAFSYVINGFGLTKAAVPIGTAFSAQTIPMNTWGCYRVSINAAGVILIAPAPDNTTGYASESAAIADVPATPLNSWNMGYLAVLTKVGSPWIAATDALQGGTSGNPASVTHYYQGETSFDGTYKMTFPLNQITGRGVQVQISPDRTYPASVAPSQGQWVLFRIEADIETSTSARDQR